MNERELSIKMTLIDEITRSLNAIEGGLQKFANSARIMGADLKQIGREISQVGSTIAFTGAAITGPFFLAFQSAGNSMDSVKRAINQLENSINNFKETIAGNLIPVVQQISNVVNNAYIAFSRLPVAVQANMIQGAAWTGVFLVMSGTIVAVSGKILAMVANLGLLTSKLAAFMALNPELMILYAVLTALVAVTLKWKAAGDAVMNSFEVLTRVILIPLQSIYGATTMVIEGLLKLVATIIAIGSVLPQAFGGQVFQELSDNIFKLSGSFEDLSKNNTTSMLQNMNEMGSILSGNTGQLAANFDKAKERAEGFLNTLINGGARAIVSTAQMKSLVEGSIGAMNQLSGAMTAYAGENKSWANAAKATAIGMATINTAQGVTKALAEYLWPFSMIVAGIVAAAGAVQIATIGSQKFHSGGVVGNLGYDEVPIIAQTGEGILSRTGMRKLGGSRLLNALNDGSPVSNLGYVQDRSSNSKVINVNVDISNYNSQFFTETGENEFMSRIKDKMLTIVDEALCH